MDADWGSSSDEETVAEREKRDEEKRKETMALLAAFEATRAPEPKGYGAMDAGAKFRQERAASAGRAIWEERRAKERIERDDEKEIAGAMKYHIVLGLVIIVILGFALFGLYDELAHGLSGPPPNATGVANATGLEWHGVSGRYEKATPRAKSKGLPPLKVILFAVALGVCIPSLCLARRQWRANKTKSFQGHFYRGVDHG